jgi:hypothetical protein
MRIASRWWVLAHCGLLSLFFTCAVRGQIITFAGDEPQPDLQGSSSATQQSSTPLFGDPDDFDIAGSGNFSGTSGGGTTTGGLDDFNFYTVGLSTLGAFGSASAATNITSISANAYAWIDDNAYNASVGSFVTLRSGAFYVRELASYEVTGTGVFAPFHGRRGIYHVGMHTREWFNISPSMGAQTGREIDALPSVQQRAWDGVLSVQARRYWEWPSMVVPIRVMGFDTGQIDTPIIDARGIPFASHRSTIDSTRTVQGYHSWGDPNGVERWSLAPAGQTAFLQAGAQDGTVAFREHLSQGGQRIIGVKYDDNEVFNACCEEPLIDPLPTLTTDDRVPEIHTTVRITSMSEPRASGELYATYSRVTGPGIGATNESVLLYKGIESGFHMNDPVVLFQTGTMYPSLPAGLSVAGLQGSDNTPNFTFFRRAVPGSPPGGFPDVFAAVTLAGAGVTPADDGAVVRCWPPFVFPNGPTILAREGTAYPWLPAGVTISGFGTLSADGNSGAICWVTLAGTGIDATNDVALLRVSDTTPPVILLRETYTANGLPFGVTLNLDGATILTPASAFHAPVLNANGRLAFASMLRGPGVDGTNDTAIFFGDYAPGFPVQLHKLARFSDATPAGGVYRNPVGFVSINARDQVVFRTGVMTQFNEPVNLRPRGIFFWDPSEGMQKVARSDDLIEYEPGSYMKLTSVDLAQPSSGNDGRGSALSDSGLLAFRVGYEGGNAAMYFTPRQ